MNEPTIDDILSAMRLFGRPSLDASIDDMARRVDIVRMLCVEATSSARMRRCARECIAKEIGWKPKA